MYVHYVCSVYMYRCVCISFLSINHSDSMAGSWTHLNRLTTFIPFCHQFTSSSITVELPRMVKNMYYIIIEKSLIFWEKNKAVFFFWIPNRTIKSPDKNIIANLKYKANEVFLRCLILLCLLFQYDFSSSHTFINHSLGIKLLMCVAEILSTS